MVSHFLRHSVVVNHIRQTKGKTVLHTELELSQEISCFVTLVSVGCLTSCVCYDEKLEQTLEDIQKTSYKNICIKI